MLNEAKARSRIYTRTFPDSVAFYAAKSGPPIAIVIKDGDHYYGVMAKAGFRQFYQSLSKKIHYEPELATSEDREYYRAIQHYLTGKAYSYEDFDMFETYPFDFNGMYKFLMNKVGVPMNVMTARYGPLPDFDDNETYRGVEIIPSINMSKQSWKLVKELLDKLEQSLSRFGFNHLIQGKLRIANLSKGVAATYQYNSEIMTISLPMLRKPEGIRMLIHEIGHKWDDLSNLDQVIVKKFVEVKEAGHSFDFVSPVEIGEQFRLAPSVSRKYSKFVFKAVGITPKGISASIEGERGSITIPFDLISKGGTILDLSGNPLDIVSGDAWFPTKYSMSSHKEFFAELFLFWIMGEGSDEAAQWLSSLPKP